MIVNIFGYFVLFIIYCGYAHLLYIFNHNLFLLVLSQRQTIINEQDIELNHRQIHLLSTIRKHTILAGLIIMSEVLYLIISISGIISYSGHYIWWYLHGICLLIFVNAPAISIYLGFSANQGIYRKLCGVCDDKCKAFCLRLTARRLNKQGIVIDDYVSMNDS